MQNRPLSNVAHDILRDWKTISGYERKFYAALPYLRSMLEMDKITDAYMYDTGRGIVAYFLSNAAQWRGPVAKLLKAELRAM
jgi:hypothetical protein